MTDMLEQHFARLRNPADDSDWLAVRRRAGRPARRLVLAAAALVAAGLLVTPALGIGGRVLDLIQGQPAPRPVQESFAMSNELREQFLEQHAEAREEFAARFPRVIPSEARGVTALETVDGPVFLWAAPTEDGRQCWLIQTDEEPGTGRPGGFGSCDGDEPAGSIRPEGPMWTYVRPSITLMHIRVLDQDITRVEVELEDATSMSLPVQSGHVLAITPREAQAPNVVVGRNADGEVVARWTRPGLG